MVLHLYEKQIPFLVIFFEMLLSVLYLNVRLGIVCRLRSRSGFNSVTTNFPYLNNAQFSFTKTCDCRILIIEIHICTYLMIIDKSTRPSSILEVRKSFSSTRMNLIVAIQSYHIYSRVSVDCQIVYTKYIVFVISEDRGK